MFCGLDGSMIEKDDIWFSEDFSDKDKTLWAALRTKLLAKHGAKLEIIRDIYNSKYSTWIAERKIWEWQCLREGIKHYDQFQWPYGVPKTEVTALTYSTAITTENKPRPCHSIAPVIIPREIKSTALTSGPDGDLEMVAGAGLTDTLGNRSLVIGGGRGRGRGNARLFPNGALARTSRNVLRLQQQVRYFRMLTSTMAETIMPKMMERRRKVKMRTNGHPINWVRMSLLRKPSISCPSN
jgi:hypothetical protein